MDWYLLYKLKVNSIDSFLVHHCNDLNRKDSQVLIEWLTSLKQRSLVRRIGVSVYDPSDIDFLPLDKIDVIQLPLSLYDQRFLAKGIINYLISSNICVHVRSVFLQGLILQPSENWPDFLSEKFKEHHYNFNLELQRLGQSPLEATLSFIYQCKGIEAALFGVTELSELISLVNTWNSFKVSNIYELPKNNSIWAWTKTNEIDPRTWPNQ